MKFWLIYFYPIMLSLHFNEARYKSYGGKNADNGQFPYIALLSYVGIGAAGASIIHERWVVTAAHCKLNFEEYGKPLITVGTVGDFESGQTYEIEEFYVHPGYIVIPEEENDGLEYIVNDIGLIRLASGIPFNYNVRPIKLEIDEDKSYANSMATLPGWGMSKYGENISDHLRFIKVRVLTLKECRKAWPYADKHICTSTQEHQGACYGDSGTGLVIDGKLIGVTSTADKYCESLKPDLYTKVASFIPWIKGILARHGDVLPHL